MRRRTFNERNSLSLVSLIKSSTFGPGIRDRKRGFRAKTIVTSVFSCYANINPLGRKTFKQNNELFTCLCPQKSTSCVGKPQKIHDSFDLLTLLPIKRYAEFK